MSHARSLRFSIGASVALLVLVAAGGCQERLAQRDAYFAPFGGFQASASDEPASVIRYHQTLHAVRIGCSEAGSTAEPAGPGSAAGAAWREAADAELLARLCEDAGEDSYAAYGGASNAYRRWVEDEVRELPKPSDTASAISD